MNPDAVVTESSPVLEIPAPGPAYDHWRKTGERELPTTAEPAPAKETSAEPEKVESAPESAPGTILEKARAQHKGTPAPERIKQLLEQNKAKDAEIARLKAGTKPQAESAPAKSVNPLEAPKKPKQDDFKTWEEFDAARDDYYEKKASYEAHSAVEGYKQQQVREAGERAIAEKVAEAKKVYPDLDADKLGVIATEISGDQAMPLMVKQRIGRSTVMPHLLYVLTGDPAKWDAFRNLAKTDPLAANDELVLMEQLIKQELGKKSEATVEEKPTPEKKVTNAPPPPREANGKGTVPPDAVGNALENDDFEAYKKSKNASDLSRRRK